MNKQDKHKGLLIRVLKTMGLTLLLCVIWIFLELMIYGKVEDRLVDNIMMLLIIPIIYKAVK